MTRKQWELGAWRGQKQNSENSFWKVYDVYHFCRALYGYYWSGNGVACADSLVLEKYKRAHKKSKLLCCCCRCCELLCLTRWPPHRFLASSQWHAAFWSQKNIRRISEAYLKMERRNEGWHWRYWLVQVYPENHKHLCPCCKVLRIRHPKILCKVIQPVFKAVTRIPTRKNFCCGYPRTMGTCFYLRLSRENESL